MFALSELIPSSACCLDRIAKIVSSARSEALKRVNHTMILAYWHIGREIVEEEQRGKGRADYGIYLINKISKQLADEFGKGFGVRNLRSMRKFYLTFIDRLPSIWHSTSAKLPEEETSNTEHCESRRRERDAFFPGLSWTHYRTLLSVPDPNARSFYEIECARSGWTVRELQRQINSLLFERLARSRDKDGVLKLARKGHEIQNPSDLVKDPYVLEFVGLPDSRCWLESDLEKALLDRLQNFLLELGRDLFFVARQKRITLEGDHFYIDLVFYHRILRCFLLIDLKLGKLSQQDIGQMLLYTGWFEAEENRDDENPPIGLVLCTDKNEAVVRYTLSRTASRVFASRYQLHMPSAEELSKEILREKRRIEEECSGGDNRG